MKKNKNKITKEIEGNNFIEDKYYSKLIKYIDAKLTFNNSMKKIKIIKNNDKFMLTNYNKMIQKNKELKNKNKNKSFNIKVEKDNNNIYNNEFNKLNAISRLKRLSYLPKISPFIHNNKTSISIDYNKANEMGARGFRSLCNNESESIKEILLEYNDHNFKNYEDYNSFIYFNKVNDQLKNIDTNTNTNINTNKSETNNKINEDEKNMVYEYNYKNNDVEIKNIFDINYIEKKKVSKYNKLLKNKIERIKIQNQKVNKILQQYKKKYYKDTDNRIYKINYNSIQKHIPYTIINTKSKRIFSYTFLNNNIDNTKCNDNIKHKDNKILSDRIKHYKLKERLPNKFLYSSMSFNKLKNDKYYKLLKYK